MDELQDGALAELVKELKKQNNPFKQWATVGMMLVTALLSGAAGWGASQGKIADLEKRVDYLEAQHFIPGDQGVNVYQFQEFRADIIARLARIETKQDEEIRRNK